MSPPDDDPDSDEDTLKTKQKFKLIPFISLGFYLKFKNISFMRRQLRNGRRKPGESGKTQRPLAGCLSIRNTFFAHKWWPVKWTAKES